MYKVGMRETFAAVVVFGLLACGSARAQLSPDPMAPGATPSAADAAGAAGDAAKKMAPKPKMKPKPKVSKLPSVEVVVTNSRSVGLVELTAALAGGADPVKIAGPLAAGKKAVAHVAHDKACIFDLHGSYADGAEIESTEVNLCKDKKISLTD